MGQATDFFQICDQLLRMLCQWVVSSTNSAFQFGN